MDFEAAKIYHYVGLTIAVVAIVAGVNSIKEAGRLDEFGATAMMSALIVSAVVFSGLIRDSSSANTERIANIERMVKALYDRTGLGGSPAGRAGSVGGDSGGGGGDGRGRNGTSSGGGSEGNPGTRGAESRNGG